MIQKTSISVDCNNEPKAGPYNGVSDDLHSEIFRYCHAIDKPFMMKKNDNKMA